MVAAQFDAALVWDSKRDAANWLRIVSALATLPLCMVSGLYLGSWGALGGAGTWAVIVLYLFTAERRGGRSSA